MIKSFICGVSGTALMAQEREFLAQEQPYGVILFARNIESPAQVRALTTEIKSLLTHPYAEILVDQEGGRVQRLKPPHWRTYPTAAKLAAQKDAARAVYVNARLIAEELRSVGITTETPRSQASRRAHSDLAVPCARGGAASCAARAVANPA